MILFTRPIMPLLTYILFADDTNLFYSHKNLNTLTTTLNCEVDKVSKWFKCNKLSLNINKTCCIYFSHNRSHNAPIHDPILIDGSPLSFKDTTKFLGVTIDSHLSWDNHILAFITQYMQLSFKSNWYTL